MFEAAPADPFQSARARFQGPLKRKIGWNGKWVPSHAVLTSAGNLHFFHVDASEQPTSRDDDVSLHISMATVRAHSDGVTLQLACYTHHGKKVRFPFRLSEPGTGCLSSAQCKNVRRKGGL